MDQFTYSISEFPGSLVNIGKLDEEIRVSGISKALSYVKLLPETAQVEIKFKVDLLAADETILHGDTTPPTGLISSHDGTPTPAEIQEVVIPNPTVVVPFPATPGFRTWFTSAGDDMNPTYPASGRGDGARLKLNFDNGPGEKVVEIQFSEPVELHDGEMYYKPVDNFDVDDEATLSIKVPANDLEELGSSSSSSSSGNEEYIDVGVVNGYVVVPGHPLPTHRLDLATAMPIPAGHKANGYFDVDPFTGVVTVSATPGAAAWHVLTVPIESFFMKPIVMGSPRGVLDVDVYKAEWLHPSWTVKLCVNKSSAGNGKVGVWLMCFRETGS